MFSIECFLYRLERELPPHTFSKDSAREVDYNVFSIEFVLYRICSL